MQLRRRRRRITNAAVFLVVVGQQSVGGGDHLSFQFVLNVSSAAAADFPQSTEKKKTREHAKVSDSSLHYNAERKGNE